MKAQVGLEYMAVFTLMIVFLIPLFYIANQRMEVSRTTSEARTAMNTIVTSVNAVYAQSPGSRLTVNVYIPTGYYNSTSYLANRTIVMKFNLADGTPYEVLGFTKGNISGRLPPYSGYHLMTFTLNQNGSVLINTTAV